MSRMTALFTLVTFIGFVVISLWTVFTPLLEKAEKGYCTDSIISME